jgi:hypothetical protein
MKRTMRIQRSVFVMLASSCVAAAWWGCSANPPDSQTGGSSGSPTTTTQTTTGKAGTGGTGGIGGDFDGGAGVGGAPACTSISAVAERVPLDMVFLIDRSESMAGMKWTGTTTALTEFFNDPASIKIGAGLVYFPHDFPNDIDKKFCAPETYQVLDVPIDVLPANTFSLTNSFPAEATGYSGTPTYGALKGALQVATAYQDSHPNHKVIVVLATDGEPWGCPETAIDPIAALAKSARNYNGVLTYVIGVSGSIIANLNKIAAAGGTKTAYDITNDITQFSAKMKEIREEALGCQFEIPPPPNGKELDPEEVNFSYTPEGMGAPKLLLHADDILACKDKPGWYYDNPFTPTKIILCPASCATVQADLKAEVNVLFGCKTQIL